MGATGTGGKIVVVDGLNGAEYATQPFSGRVQQITGLALALAALDDTGLDTEDYMESIPADLADVEEITVSVLSPASDTIPKLKEINIWEITYPGTVDLIIAGSAFITRYVQSEMVPNQRKIHTFNLKFDNKSTKLNITPVPAAGTP